MKLKVILWFPISIILCILVIIAIEWLKRSKMPSDHIPPKAVVWSTSRIESTHFCQPLNEPVWHKSSDSAHMRSDDTVLGIYLDDQAWALPWWILKNHHVANLTLGDQPVLIGFCEMCSNASGYDPMVEGKRLNFKLGGLYNGSNLMLEVSTNYYWDPVSGAALTGAHKGTFLKLLPVHQSTWDEWLEMHPDTMVLYDSEEMREGHGSHFRPGGEGIGSTFIGTLLNPLDERLPHHTLVLGIGNSKAARAYPLAELDKSGSVLLNDRLGTNNIVILRKTGSLLAMAFSRELNGKNLTFEQTQTNKIRDVQTQSLWNLHGQAYEGELKGEQLSFVDSKVKEWYGWAAAFPNTELFSVPN